MDSFIGREVILQGYSAIAGLLFCSSLGLIYSKVGLSLLVALGIFAAPSILTGGVLLIFIILGIIIYISLYPPTTNIRFWGQTLKKLVDIKPSQLIKSISDAVSSSHPVSTEAAKGVVQGLANSQEQIREMVSQRLVDNVYETMIQNAQDALNAATQALDAAAQ